MAKIQFKRKKSTGISTNKLSAGEPLYNLQDKKLYIGGNASEDETPSKHLTEVGVSTAGKVSIGAATNNDFTIAAGNGIDITGNAANRTIKVDIESTYKPSEAMSADKLKTGRTITLSGAVTGSTTFDGTSDKTISTSYSISDSKSANKIVRYISTDPNGKLTTTKGTLTAGDYITISETGDNLTIAADTELKTLEAAGNEIAFSINGKEYKKSISVEGVELSVGSAQKWTTPRTISLTGGATGSVSIDGSKDVSLNVAIKETADHKHGNITNSGTVGNPSKVVITDANNKVTTSSVSSDELSYLTGVKSSIQDQLDKKSSDEHKHKLLSASATLENPSSTVSCVNLTVNSGVLKVTSVLAASSSHIHSVSFKDVETGTPED